MTDIPGGLDPRSSGRITIDLNALVANWRDLKGRLAATCVCGAAVKANAYGIGLKPAAAALAAAGCRDFFVATPEEGLRLRSAQPTAHIHVLNGLYPGAAGDYVNHRLVPVLNAPPEVEEWLAFCRARGEAFEAALHVDTGMNRLGLTANEAEAVARAHPAFSPTLVISHLACADTPEHPLSALQLERFSRVRTLFPNAAASLANSAGVLLGPDYHFDLVRPGIALYGGSAGPGTPLRTVVTVETRILQMRSVAPGETIGYGAAFTAERPMRIAVIAAGYADGYLRQAGSSDGAPGGFAALAGHRLPIAGRVSMDLIALDVGDLGEDVAHRGALVELIGDTVPVDAVAEAAGTIGYELLTQLSPRLDRHYIGLPADGTGD